MYRKQLDHTGRLACIVRVSDETYIPLSEGNADYATFLAWVKEGNVPADDPSFSLDAIRAAKNAEINAWRLEANSSTFEHDGKLFACDALSRGDIDGTTSTLLMTDQFPQPWPGYWKAVDNTHYPIATIDEWRAFLTSMAAAGAANFMRSQQLKAALAACTTVDEIQAIRWESQ